MVPTAIFGTSPPTPKFVKFGLVVGFSQEKWEQDPKPLMFRLMYRQSRMRPLSYPNLLLLAICKENLPPKKHVSSQLESKRRKGAVSIRW